MVLTKAEDRITKSKIKLGKQQPFFSYLLLYLKVLEGKNLPMPTMGVDVKGNLHFDRGFVDGLDNEVLTGCVIHEVMHLATQTMFRQGKRDAQIFNVASDIIINYIIYQNGFKLPEGTLIPDGNKISLPMIKHTVKDLDKKNAEVVYDEIYDKIKKNKCKIGYVGADGKIYDSNGKPMKGDNNTITVFDAPMEGKGKDGKPMKASEIEKESKEWKKRLVEAGVMAKRKGAMPNGMDRLIGDIVNNKVNWKALLRKYVTNEVVSDFSWSRPSKRSHSLGTYLPHTLKENVEIVVALDTSGSIGQKELTQFVSEIVHIARSVSNIKMTVIECDAEIHQELEVKNGNIKTILGMKIKGGGGTSHEPVWKYMLEKKKNVRFLVNLTDGYTDFPSDEEQRRFHFETVWVITPDGCDENHIPKSKRWRTIKMEGTLEHE